MAITPFLLEPKFNINPFLQQTFHLAPLRYNRFPIIKLSYGYSNALKLKYSSSVIRYSTKLSSKCFSMSLKPNGENGIGRINGGGEDNHLKTVAISNRTNEVLWRSIKNVLIKALQIPVITGVLLGLLLLYGHQNGYVALAASGGRMGGSCFSSQSSERETSSPSSSSSSGSSDSSYSSTSSWSSSSDPEPSSYSSSSWSSSWSDPEPSYSSSSSSWSSSSKSSKSYSTQTKDPVSSEDDGFSVGVDQPAVATKPSDGDGTNILWALFCICGLIVIMVAVIELDVFELGDRKRYTATQNTVTAAKKTVTAVEKTVTAAEKKVTVAEKTVTATKKTITAAKKTSVIKLQVGLLGTARSLQGDLNRIAEAADTSTPQGLSYILQETILALIQHPDYCISGYSWVDAKSNIVEVEELFNRLSIEERAKFDDETLVNVNNIRKQSATTQKSNEFHNEYIVITIIVASGGVYELPLINSSAKLKETLQKLAAIPSSRIMAVEVLWTPQNENDTLTEQEYLEDYPLLHPL